MANPDDIRIHYSGKDLGSDGATPATRTVDSGTATTFVDAALTEANDYWVGANIKWLTGNNAGYWGSVYDFVAASDTVEFDESLPNAVVIGETCQLFLSLGGYRASEQIVMRTATAPSNVTGVVLPDTGIAGRNPVGAGTLTYTLNGGGAARALQWTPASGSTIGSKVQVGGGDATYTLYAADRSYYLKATVTIASLPVGDQSDTITLSQPRHRFFGPIRGAENSAGVTRYGMFVVYSAAASVAISAYLRKGEWLDSSGVAQTASETTVAAIYAASGAITLRGTDLSTWPARGHVLNATTSEILFYQYRYGNNLVVAASGRGIRGTAASAGAVSEIINLIPPIDIGIEIPAAGVYQTVANENVAPVGLDVGFGAPITSEAGHSIGDLAATEHVGVWVREVTPAGGVPSLNVLEGISFTMEG